MTAAILLMLITIEGVVTGVASGLTRGAHIAQRRRHMLILRVDALRRSQVAFGHAVPPHGRVGLSASVEGLEIIGVHLYHVAAFLHHEVVLACL